jgi:hypothetical protein
MKKLRALALAIVAASASTANAGPLDDVPIWKCSDIVTPDGQFTDKTKAVAQWLVGYRDGIAALASLDPRFKSIGDMDSTDLGASVVTICRSKRDMTVAQVTASVMEMMINAMPGGDVISLALPERP